MQSPGICVGKPVEHPMRLANTGYPFVGIVSFSLGPGDAKAGRREAADQRYVCFNSTETEQLVGNNYRGRNTRAEKRYSYCLDWLTATKSGNLWNFDELVTMLSSSTSVAFACMEKTAVVVSSFERNCWLILEDLFWGAQPQPVCEHADPASGCETRVDVTIDSHTAGDVL